MCMTKQRFAKKKAKPDAAMLKQCEQYAAHSVCGSWKKNGKTKKESTPTAETTSYKKSKDIHMDVGIYICKYTIRA